MATGMYSKSLGSTAEVRPVLRCAVVVLRRAGAVLKVKRQLQRQQQEQKQWQQRGKRPTSWHPPNLACHPCCLPAPCALPLPCAGGADSGGECGGAVRGCRWAAAPHPHRQDGAGWARQGRQGHGHWGSWRGVHSSMCMFVLRAAVQRCACLRVEQLSSPRLSRPLPAPAWPSYTLPCPCRDASPDHLLRPFPAPHAGWPTLGLMSTLGPCL
jgi:hypothetical protein